MAKGAEPISLDMTKAITMEPLPDNTRVLCAVSAFDLRKSARGNPSAHVELTILKPEEPGYLNRKLFDDINLENEYTLGRLLNLLKGLGMPEDDIRKPDFKLIPEDIVGLRCTVICGVRKSEQYGDRNSIKRVRSADSFEAVEY